MTPRFEVVRRLGAGGQGQVLAVRDAAFGGAELALKETPAERAADLLREFSVLDALRHPHIARVVEVFPRSPLAPASGGEGPCPAAYTQELVPGDPIRLAMARPERPGDRQLVFEQLLRALAYLHAVGVLHLDVKPGNVLVVPRRGDVPPLAKLLDFGIAARVPQAGLVQPEGASDDRVRGTLRYLAPERLEGAAPTPGCDLFAAGLVMAEILAGELWEPSAVRPGGALVDDAARDAWLTARGVSGADRALVLPLTRPDPALRPATAAEAARAWSEARGEPVPLHPPAVVQAMVRAGRTVGRDEVASAAREALDALGACLPTGPPGVGCRATARAVAGSLQADGQRVAWWPRVPSTRSASGFGRALAWLLDAPPLELAFDAAERELAAVEGRGDVWARSLDGLAVSLGRAIAEAEVGSAPATLAVLDAEPLPPLVQQVLARRMPRVGAPTPGRAHALRLLWPRPASEVTTPATLRVEPLDRDAVEAWAAGRLGHVAGGGARFTAVLAAASGGLPRSLETLTALWIARGDLRFDGERWSLSKDPEALPTPEGASAVQARVAALEPQLRDTLAAVAFCRVPARAARVAAVLRATAPRVDAALAGLEASGLIWRGVDGAAALALGEGLEACAGWTPPGGPAASHARALNTAEPGSLAWAWHQRGSDGAAVATAAARRWMEQGRLEAAATALELALELQPDALDALEARAAVADRLGPRSVQIGCLERLLTLRGGAAAGREGRRVAGDLLWALTRTGDAERAVAIGEPLVAALRGVEASAERPGVSVARAEVEATLAIAHTQRGDYGRAEELLEAALEALSGAGHAAAGAPRADTLALQARVANNLGNVLAYRGDCVGALARYGDALAFKRREGDPVGQRIATGNMGLMALRLGRAGDALGYLAESLRVARQTGHRRGESWTLLALAVLGLEAGCLPWAARRAERSLELAEALGDRLIACDARTTLAEIALAEGRAEEARDLAEAGLTEALEAASPYNAAWAECVVASAWLELPGCGLDGVAGRALAALERAGGEGGSDDEGVATRASAKRLLSEVALRRGDLDGAVSWARKAWRVASQAPPGGLRGALPGVVDTVARALALAGHAGESEHVRRAGAEAVGAREAAWPPRPPAPDTDIDGATAADGPSRARWRAWAKARGLEGRAPVGVDDGRAAGRAGPPGTGDGAMGEMSSGTEAGGRGPGLEAWLAKLAVTAPKGIVPLVGRWLGELVPSVGAERGFLLDEAGELVAARDADGEPVMDAGRKVPKAAEEEARRAGQPYRASGQGRGTVIAVPVAAGPTRDAEPTPTGVLVLQNRFVVEAFEGLEQDAARLAPAGVALRLRRQAREGARLLKQVSDSDRQREQERTRNTEEILSLRRELEATRELAGPEHAYSEIVFRSRAMIKTLRRVDRIVDTALPVYVHGESGTGKELIARAVHAHGPRADGPFVAQNCSAVPAQLFESEFFGHERGAFTGADRAAEGLFRRAHGGTLFLDEMGDLPLDLQAKLLRVLETGEVRPVGGRKVHRVDVRIVCATHRDLKDLVADGAFREDLFYRLNVVRVDLPPLRERPDDVPLLVDHFLKARASADGRDVVPLDDGVMKALMRFPWPGNVRQLENEITRAALLCDGLIRVTDLSDEVQATARGRAGRRAAATSGGRGPVTGLDHGTLKDRVDRLEAWVLDEAMKAHGGNKSAVARELDLSRAGLLMKLRRLGLHD